MIEIKYYDPSFYTKRQNEIIKLKSQLPKNKDVAEQLGIKESTTKQHINKILKTKSCPSMLLLCCDFVRWEERQPIKIECEKNG